MLKKSLFYHLNRFKNHLKELALKSRAYSANISFFDNRENEIQNLYDDIIERYEVYDKIKENICCMRPFENIEISKEGNVYVCCTSWMKYGTYIGNLYESTFEEVWNSKMAKKIRYSVSEGKFEYCTNFCDYFHYLEGKDLQNIDLSFTPIIERKNLKTRYNNFNESIVSGFPKKISLGCDISCNLRCKTCRDPEKIKLERLPSQEQIELMLYEKVRPALKECQELTLLTSGEVFASKAVSNFAKSLTVEDFPNLRIILYSNAQLLTKDKWEEFSNIKKFPLTLRISIDAAQKDTYEKIRLGGKWDILCKNMDLIAQMRQNKEIDWLTINFVVQRDNYKEMHSFVELGKKWHAGDINFQKMSNWGSIPEEEYTNMNVCDINHPQFHEVINTLKDIKEHENTIQISTNII